MSSYSKIYLKIGNLVLSNRPDITIREARLGREDKIYEFEGDNNPGTQRSIMGEATDFPVNLFLQSGNPGALYEELRAEESVNNLGVENGLRNVLHNPWTNSGTPTPELPLRACKCIVPAWPGDGGPMNSAVEINHTLKPSGAIEFLTALPEAPANVTVGNETQTTLDVEWDADIEYLVRRPTTLRGLYFDVHRGETAGGPYVKVNTTPVSNPGTGKVTFQDTGLTGSKAYYYLVRLVDIFGLESADSAEANGSTTASLVAGESDGPTTQEVLAEGLREHLQKKPSRKSQKKAQGKGTLREGK